MTQIVYCNEDRDVRALPFSEALEPAVDNTVFRGNAPSLHMQCNNDSVVVWWGPHNSIASFERLLSIEMKAVRPTVCVFTAVNDMPKYLNTYASIWPDKLDKLKIFSSDASLDKAAKEAMTGKLVPTGKWTEANKYIPISLKEPEKWLCNYCSENDTARGNAVAEFKLNPYGNLHVMRYLLGNAIVNDNFRLLLYAHKTKYSPKLIASDLEWWPDSVKSKLWLVLYTGGNSKEISDATCPEIAPIRKCLGGRFARHCSFMQSDVLYSHKGKFSATQNFDPELPEPIALVALSILCQGYTADETKAKDVLSPNTFSEVFGKNWKTELPKQIQSECGMTPLDNLDALIKAVGKEEQIGISKAKAVCTELAQRLTKTGR